MYPELSKICDVKVHIDVCIMHLQIFYACRDLHQTGNRSLSQSPGGISLCLCSAHSPGLASSVLLASPPFGIPLQFQNG